MDALEGMYQAGLDDIEDLGKGVDLDEFNREERESVVISKVWGFLLPSISVLTCLCK